MKGHGYPPAGLIHSEPRDKMGMDDPSRDASKPRMLRIFTSIAITTFFIVMCAVLWRREAALDYTVQGLGISPDHITATWEDYEEWMWIDRAGTRLGVYMMRIRSNDAGGYDMIARSRLTLPILNQAMALSVDSAVKMSDRFEMETFQGRLTVGGNEISVDAFVDGLRLFYRLQGPELLVEGGGATMSLALEKPVMLTNVVLPILTRNTTMKVGDRWTILASDPITGRLKLPVSVEVDARESISLNGENHDVLRVIEKSGSVEATSWYSRDGKRLRTETAGGLTLTRARSQEASEHHPELKREPMFAPIDRDRLRNEAAASTVETTSLLPWLPQF